jgi:pimeloyl-ACP methyl ester carboxylesterase
VLLIHGKVDNLIPIQRAREIQSKVGRTQLVPLPGAGHMPMMEYPQKVAEALKRFL